MYKLPLPPNCPLAGAHEDALILYRLVKGDQLSDADLVSHVETSDRYRGQCIAYGISLFKTRKGVLQAYRDAKERNKELGTHVAKIRVESRHGRLHTKDDDHYTLWLYDGVVAGDFQCLRVGKVEVQDGPG